MMVTHNMTKASLSLLGSGCCGKIPCFTQLRNVGVLSGNSVEDSSVLRPESYLTNGKANHSIVSELSHVQHAVPPSICVRI